MRQDTEGTRKKKTSFRARAEKRAPRDSAARKQTTQLLRESEERFRILSEAAFEGIAILVQEKIVDANQALADMFGYELSELIGMSALELAAPESRDLIKQNILSRFAQPYIAIGLKKDGARIIGELQGKTSSHRGQRVRVTAIRDITERKRVEEELRESERRYRDLFENANDIVYTHDLAGNFTSINRAAERITGYPRDQALKLNISQVLAPEYLEPVRQSLAPESLGTGPLIHQLEIITQEGRRIPLELSTRLIFQNHKPVGVQGIARDITERLHAEEARQRAEENYHSIFENAVEGIFQSTSEGRFISANPALARMWGYASPQELITSIADIAQQIYADPLRRAEFKRLMDEHGEVRGFEFRVRRKDGSVMWVSENSRAVRDAAGAMLYYEGTAEDITARKQAEEALRESEERFSSAFEHAAIGMALVAPDGRWLKVNRALSELSGYSESELLSKTFQDITHPDDLEADLAYVRQMLAGEIHTYQMEKRYLHKLGHVVWILLSVSLVWDALDEPLCFIAQIQDITERKRAEQALQDRADEFAALYETTRDLGVQQDLPTLLTALVERANVLLNAASGFVYLFDLQRRDLELVIEQGFTTPLGTHLEIGEGMAGRVAQTLQPLIVGNYHNWEQRSPKYEGTQIGAVVEVPILFGGELIGVLGVQEIENTTRKFTDADARLLTLFAGQAASVVYNAHLFEVTKRRADEFAALYDTARDLAQVQDLPALLQTIVERAIRLLGTSGGGMYIFDAVRGDLEVKVATHSSTPIGTRLQMGEGMAGRVAQTRQPLIVDDYRTWSHRSPKFKDTPLTAVIEVPMLYGGELIGVLVVEEVGDTGRKFAEEDARLLSLFAGQAASAVYNARLFEETKQHAEELAALYDTTRDLATQSNLTALLQTIIDRATTLLHAPGAFVYLFDPARHNLHLRMVKGASVPIGTRLELGEGMAGRVAQSHQPLIIDDYHTWEHRSKKYDDSPFTAVVEVPMLYGGELIGVLAANEIGATTRKFTEADARLLSLFAAQAAGAVHNARLFEETLQRAQRQEALYRISTRLAESQGAHQLCETLVRACYALLGYPFLGIFLREPATGDRVLQAQRGWDNAPGDWRLHPGQGISEQPLLTGQLYYCPDVSREPHYVQGLPSSRSELDLPIKTGDLVLGVMTVEDPRLDAFDQDDFDVLQAVANQLAVALENARLFEETRQRLTEMQAVNKISTALRAAQTIDEMLPILLEKSMSALDVSAASIWLHDPSQDKLHLVAERGFPHIEMSLDMSAAIAGHVFTTGQTYLSSEFKSDPLTDEFKRAQVSTGLGGTCVPIRAADQVIGAFFVSLQLPRQLASGDVHLLTTIAEIAGNAIHRTRLHEQTKQQLQRLDALHTVDKTITSSLDLRLTLGVILTQIASQLHADAASVLLLNPHTKMLEFAAGHGFRTRVAGHPTMHLGESLAGRAAIERRIISIPNLAEHQIDVPRGALFAAEGFTVYCGVPLIAKGQVKGVLEVFNRSPLVTEASWLPFLETLAEQAAIAIDSIGLFQDLQRSNMELSLAYDTTLEGWSRALDLRDRETEGHTQRAVELTLRLAREMGIGESELVHIRRGVLLHDIGKMGIPDSILHKPGPLTPAEMSIMSRHPEHAFELLAPIQYLQRALDIPYCHHEKWDGTGYPRGLKGEVIPLAARIFALIDVWDALSSDRPYRLAWPKDRVRAHIREQSGLHFDPQVVETFFRVMGDE